MELEEIDLILKQMVQEYQIYVFSLEELQEEYFQTNLRELIGLMKLWMYRKNDIKEVKWEIPKKDEKPRIYKENRENEQRKLSFYVDGKKVY